MKNRIILTSVILSIVICSCKKNKTEQTAADNYFFTAVKNNVSWSGAPFIGTFQDTLKIGGAGKNEVVGMKIKFNNTGTYILTGGQGYNWQTLGGDAIVAQYKLRADTVSWVTVTAYDPATKITEGTFELKFVQSYPVTASPAKVSFTNGKFRAVMGN